jgi:hypothetical protein
MFLNQVNFMWRDLGRANGRRAALLLLGPFVVFVFLALPAATREIPVVAEHAELSGTDSRTGPQIHLRDSYRVTVTTTGGACSFDVGIGGWGFTTAPFPSDATGSRTWVQKMDLVDVQDGLYRIAVTATRCGPWTVILDRQ